MPYEEIVLEAEERMEKTLEVLASDLKGIRTGRATPALVENIRVEYYGSPTPLKQLASITTPDPRMLMIKPFDPSSVAEIEKAILKSAIGINPQSDGKILRLPVPPLSEETRRKMVDQLKDFGEKAKVALRNVRRDAIKQAEDEQKGKTISEDDKFRIKEEVQKLTEQYEKKSDAFIEKKTKEMMEV